MSMSSEIFFRATLKEDTPEEVVNTLKMYLIEEKAEENPYFDYGFLGRGEPWFKTIREMNQDGFNHSWSIIFTAYSRGRSDIDSFLNWIKPYIEYGYGVNDTYAYVTFDEGETEIFSLN